MLGSMSNSSANVFELVKRLFREDGLLLISTRFVCHGTPESH